MAKLRDQPRTYTSGLVLSPGARCYFYLHGTLTPAPVYAAPITRANPADLSTVLYRFETEHPNPLKSDSAARLPPVYLDPAVVYRMRMLDAVGNLLHDLDPFTFFFGPESITAQDDAGAALPLATITTYLSRTTEVQGTYTADAAGVFGDITLDNAALYRVAMRDAGGRLIYDVDPIPGTGLIIAGGGQAARVPTFVAGKQDTSAAAIMTSSDGQNWTLQTTPIAMGVNGLAYSPTLRLLVAVGGIDIHTSPDGITWTVRTNPAGVMTWNDVTWSPALGIFLAVANNGTHGAMTSPDGINWTLQTTPNRQWTAVRWSPQLAMFAAGTAVGLGLGFIQSMMTSPDGVAWTMHNSQGQSVGFAFTCYKLAVDPASGYFIGSSRGEFGVLKSTDGNTWTFISTALGGSAYTDVECDGAGKVLLTRIGGDHSFARSLNDGTTWANTVNGDFCEDVCYSAPLGRWVGVGNANSPSGKKAMYSSDGTNWTDGTTPAGANLFPSWFRVIYCDL